MSTRDDSPQPGTSGAIASRDGNQGNAICPACWDIDTECSGSCRHCFCPYCVWDWSLGEPVCPQCQRPARHGFPQHVVLYHEVQDQVYENKRRRRRSFARRARSCRDGTPGRGHRWWSRGRDPSRRRRRRSRERDDTWDEGRAPRSEWDTPGVPRGRRSRRGSRRPWSWDQQERPWGHHGRQRWRSGHREHSHGWDRQWSRSRRRGHGTWSQGTEPHDCSTRQRRWRSTNPGQGRAPRHQQDTPGSSGRGRYRRRTWSPAGHGTP